MDAVPITGTRDKVIYTLGTLLQLVDDTTPRDCLTVYQEMAAITIAVVDKYGVLPYFVTTHYVPLWNFHTIYVIYKL